LKRKKREVFVGSLLSNARNAQ